MTERTASGWARNRRVDRKLLRSIFNWPICRGQAFLTGFFPKAAIFAADGEIPAGCGKDGGVRPGVCQMGDRTDLDAVLDAVARGRTEAFGRVVRAYALPLRSYLASQVHHLEDMDDLAQEVFLAALESLPTFRRGDDFGAWLRGIARNKLLVFFRSHSRQSKALQDFREKVDALVEDELERVAASDRAETIERLLLCIARLPERLRRLVRAGLDGDKPVELAAALSTTVGVIYNLHHRANQLLRECFQKGVG
jgi:RNA polymerase sigma-70 factor (ECF subfamily)